MASINVGEEDFTAVAMAACAARDDGDMPMAKTLDKLARKINLALSSNALSAPARFACGGPAKKRTWRDMPSPLDSIL